jgi:hypothetical protein
MTTRLGHALAFALALVSLLCGTLSSGPASHGVLVAARDTSPEYLNAKRLEAVERWRRSARDQSGASNARRATDTSAPPRVKNITFSNPKASREYNPNLKSIRTPSSRRLMCFLKSSTSMARPFLSSTLMLARRGRV